MIISPLPLKAQIRREQRSHPLLRSRFMHTHPGPFVDFLDMTESLTAAVAHGGRAGLG